MKRLSLALVLCTPLGAAASCGSAFCMLDTQWSMHGVNVTPGTRFDLHYEYINQNRVQNGRTRIGVGEIPRDHDEVQTVNRNFIGTLQPGTGTTDALFGAFLRRALPLKDLSWFVQSVVQVPFTTREDYRPGRRVNIDAGMRYEATEKLGLLLQMNALIKGRDGGAQAEAEDSGGRSLFLSPGVAYALTKDFQVYSFLQLPLYQFVNGVQLVADRALVVGLSTRF